MTAITGLPIPQWKELSGHYGSRRDRPERRSPCRQRPAKTEQSENQAKLSKSGLQDAHRWPGLAAIGKVESVRISEGRTRTETRHYILSRKMSPEDFQKAVRNHWAIENKLHWVLDVQMREDDLRNRAGRGPENLAAVRRLVVSMVRLMDDKLSIRRRLLRAAHVPDYRLEIIANAAKLAETI